MRPVLRCFILILAAALWAAGPQHTHAANHAATLVLASPDLSEVLTQDAVPNAWFRYALPLRLGVRVEGTRANHGVWSAMAGGQARWTLDVKAPGAVSLDFGFNKLVLPPDAALRVGRSDGGDTPQRYAAADVAQNGTLRTPIVAGDAARIELTVPAAARTRVAFELATVHYGYRDLLQTPYGYAAFNEMTTHAVYAFGHC